MTLRDRLFFWKNNICTKHLVYKVASPSSIAIWPECPKCREEKDKKQRQEILARINKVKK